MLTRDPAELPTEAYKNIPLHELQIADAIFEQMNEQRHELNQIYLINNLSTNYRAVKEEKLLFVNHEPRSLRPHEHFGAFLRWDESKGQHHIDETATLSAPRSSPESLQIHSQHPLCSPCHDLLRTFCENSQPTNDEALAGANVVIWHHDVASLVISVKYHQCYICKTIMDTYLWTRFPSLLKETSGLVNFRIEVCWDRGGDAEEKLNFYFAAVNVSKPKHTSSNYFFLGAMCAWPGEISAAFSNPKGLFIPESCQQGWSEDERRKQLASFWVERCLGNESGGHKACAAADDDSFAPFRLLDVDSAIDTGSLRLICQKSDVTGRSTVGPRYCTLSHCWGKEGSKLIPLLRNENIEYRSKVGIAMDRLPPAFGDAVNVCNWFQIKYLWIDSLCIVQDSMEDWQKEANLMSKIYKGACLNISADAGEDSQVGLFHDTSSLDRSWPEFSSKQSDRHWTLTPSPDYFLMRIERAPSWSRAWVHSERQLSRRILRFSEHGMAWECCELGRPSYANESFPGGVPFEHFFEAENKYQIGRLEQELVPGDEETYARWNDICEVLSTKRLTYESDGWLILSTMAEDFSRLLPGEKYFAGLWGSTLPHSLLWYHKHPRGKPTVSWAELGPSWSWLSSRYPATLAHRAHVDRHSVVAEMTVAVAAPIAPECPSLPPDPFGRVKEGGLEIRGYIRPIRLRMQDDLKTWRLYVLEENLLATGLGKRSMSKDLRQLPKPPRHNDHSSSSKASMKAKATEWRYIGTSWNSTEGGLCDIYPDWKDIPDPYDCYVLFITLDQALYSSSRDTSRRQVEGLILEQATAGGNIFNRYGRILFHDEFSVKMRYQVSSIEHFDRFNRLDRDFNRAATPPEYIQRVQLQRAEESREDEDVSKAQVQGLDGLYQFDGDVQQSFPWLSKLEPSVLEII